MLRDIDTLRVFVAVADEGGVSAAARGLGAPKSSVARKLAALEGSVRTRLVQRAPLPFGLTEAGKRVYRHAVSILAEVAAIQQTAALDSAAGVVRVTAPFALAHAALSPLIPHFLARHPEIDIELIAESRRVDLVREGFDVAVRAGTLSGDTLIARRLCRAPLALVSAAGPSEPADLLDLVGRDHPTGRRRRFLANDPWLLKSQVLNGVGRAWLPLYLCREDIAAGRLVVHATDVQPDAPEIFALFASRVDVPARVRAFIDFLATELRLDG